ncbi:hypothetical protein ACWCWD_11620 [Streptomyces sp. NPDC001493]
MPHFDKHEPVFRRSKFGSHWECNPHNRVGRALRTVGIVFIGVVMLLMIFRVGPYA